MCVFKFNDIEFYVLHKKGKATFKIKKFKKGTYNGIVKFHETNIINQ